MTTASPEIYFWLIPLDENAREVLRLLGGLERYSALKSADRRGRRGLKVAVDVNADDPTTLLRLGINFDSDVKVACSFRVNHESGIVMLHDESKAQTTKILVMPNQKQAYYHFVRDRVVVNSDINPYILLGPAQFGLSWNPERELPMTLLRSRSVGLALPTYSKPKLSNDGLGRLHLVGLISKLSTGNLYRAVDVDSGLTLVTKKTWEKSNGQSSWEYDYLSRFEHPNIIKCLRYHEEDGFKWLDMEDFHDTLANGNPFFKNNATFVVSFAQQALEALYEINIKHKSLHNRVLEKNFVFKKEDGVFTFKLTNFAMMTKIDQERTKDSKGDILALSVIMKALMSKTSFENSSFQAMAEPDPKHRSNAAELLKEAFGIDHSTENPPEPTASTSGAHTAGAAGGGRGKQSRTKAPTSSRNMGQRSAHKGKQEGNLGPNDHLNRSDGEKKSGRNRRSEPQGFPTLALIPKPKMSEDTKSKHGTSTHESSRNKTKLVIRNPATELVPNHRQPYEDNENSEGSEGSEDSENSDSGSDHLEPRPVSRAPPPTLPPSKPEQNAPPPAPQKMNKWNPADYQVNNVASSSNGSYNLPSSAPGQGPPKLVVSYSPHLKAFQGQMGTGYSPDVQFPQNPRRK